MQESSRTMSLILSTLLPQLPYLLVLIVGLGLAVAMMGRCRGAAIVASIGITIQLLAFLLTLGVQFVIAQGEPRDISSRAWMMSIAYALIGLVRSGGLAAVIGAVFMGRSVAEVQPKA